MTATVKTASWWRATLRVGALVLIYFFLQDIIAPDWPALFLAPVLVVGYYALQSRIDEENLTLAGISAMIFAAAYDLFDLIVGPDWPLWLISPAVVLVSLIGFSSFTDDEDD